MLKFIDNFKKAFQISPLSILGISFISLTISITEIVGLGLLQIFLISVMGNELTDNFFLRVTTFLSNLGFDDNKLNIFKLIILFLFFKNLLQIFLNFTFFSYIRIKHNEYIHKFAYVLLSKNYSKIISEKNTKFNQIFSRYIENFVKNILGSTLKIISESIFILLIIIFLLNIKFNTIITLLTILLLFLNMLYSSPHGL